MGKGSQLSFPPHIPSLEIKNSQHPTQSPLQFPKLLPYQPVGASNFTKTDKQEG